jgi:Glu-tRNA(Gln) amidotransferase subunit E-like FAD-binding protein
MKLSKELTLFRRTEQTVLENVLDRALRELSNHSIDSQEYAKILEMVVKLHKMKEEESSSVSKDTILVVVANLLGIIMILKHEHVNVITSRAMNLLLKPR